MHVEMVDRIIGDIYGEPFKKELAYRKTYRCLQKYMDVEDIEINTTPLEDCVKINGTIWI